MQKLIPANCPIELPPQVLEQTPSPDTLLDVAIGVESYNNAVNDTLMPYGERLEASVIDKAVGHTACGSCDLLELCKDTVSAAEGIAVGIRHPVDLITELDPKSVAELWSASIVAQAEHAGYTRESSANMVGKISRLPAPLRTMIMKVLESDSTHIPTQIGKIELSEKLFEFVDFGDVRLMISESALSELEGSGGYLEGFITSTTDALLRTEKHYDTSGNLVPVTRLRHSLETNNFKGLGIKPLISSKIREFNGGAHSTLRGFGAVVGRTPEQEGSQDSIIIAHIADAKGGVNGTGRESSKVEKLVNDVSAKSIQKSIDTARENKLITSLKVNDRKPSLVTS